MDRVPARPRLYHITAIENLASIASEGLLSDAAMVARGGPPTAIGMSRLKARRLTLPVRCHAGTMVGEFVPFYFCPRSVMLYMIHKRNEDIGYRGGQDPIVHLEADMHDVIAWAASREVPWAFTPSNAAARYNTQFYASTEHLGRIDWAAVRARSWSDCIPAKGAEFLVHARLPWELVGAIGVRTPETRDEAMRAISHAAHKPPVAIRPSWYY